MEKIIYFTKPYTNKEMYVEITHNQKQNTFKLKGINVFGHKISEISKDYAKILQGFYRELCWMLNQNLMADTAIQRVYPKAAAKKYKLTKNQISNDL